MKRHYKLYQITKLIVAFEIAFCIIWTITLFLINGAGAFSVDHALLLLLIAATVASAMFIRQRKIKFKKAVLWMAILPLSLMILGAKPTLITSHHPKKLSQSANTVYMLSNTVR